MNNVIRGFKSLFQSSFVLLFSEAASSSDFANTPDNVRINPKIPNDTPDKKGKNPGPGV
ncbi:MAG TPA: hypothetical protein VLZ03_04375 [Thermodesulfobacteriota bacterium]|nr:hypothetical protein [Thermodesulfobacteriota bacterium]